MTDGRAGRQPAVGLSGRWVGAARKYFVAKLLGLLGAVAKSKKKQMPLQAVLVLL